MPTPSEIRPCRRRFSSISEGGDGGDGGDDLAQGIGAGLGREVEIEPVDGRLQALEQQHLGEGRALRGAAVGANLGLGGGLVAKRGEFDEQGLLDVGFGEEGQAGDPSRALI